MVDGSVTELRDQLRAAARERTQTDMAVVRVLRTLWLPLRPAKILMNQGILSRMMLGKWVGVQRERVARLLAADTPPTMRRLRSTHPPVTEDLWSTQLREMINRCRERFLHHPPTQEDLESVKWWCGWAGQQYNLIDDHERALHAHIVELVGQAQTMIDQQQLTTLQVSLDLKISRQHLYNIMQKL